MTVDVASAGESQNDSWSQEMSHEQAAGQAGEAVLVTRPAAGTTREIQSLPGRTYVLDFPPAAARASVQGQDFLLSFDDDGDGAADSRIVFRDMVQAAGSDNVPVFQIAGTGVAANILLDQAIALEGEAQELRDVAAGPALASGGGSSYDDNLGSLLELLAAQGVIPPVELTFGLISVEPDPLLPYFPPPPLLINEIGVRVLMQIPDASGQLPASQQLQAYNFIELHNTSDGALTTLDLTVEILNPAGALIAFQVPDGIVIPPGGFLVFYQLADDGGAAGVEDIYLRVYDAAGNFVDGIDIADADFWNLGDDTSDPLAVNLAYRVGEPIDGDQSVDTFAANLTQSELSVLTDQIGRAHV